MESFFDKVSDYLFKNYRESISELCLVLPNRRAGLFLKTAISKRFQKTIWAPEVFATEDFIAKISGLELLDSTSLLFKFYQSYCKIEADKAQPFEEFMKWAQILLSDYNEIDSYYVNTEQLFAYINENRALEVWNISGEEITEVQKNYLKFWQSFGIYYAQLKADLLEKKQAYQGLAYRLVADDISEKLNHYELKNHSWKKIIFIGFNALNDSEEKIIKTLKNQGKAEILWDADSYYLDNKIQEAGHFLRKHKEKTGLYNTTENEGWLENLLATADKKITVIGVSNNIGQAKIAGEIIQNSDNSKNFQNTALVLADENLLIPTLNSIPPIVNGFNVTMGYPLKNTPIFDLIDAVFRMQENANGIKKTSKSLRYHHKDLLLLIQNQYFKLIGNTKHTEQFFRSLANDIINRNKIFINPKDIAQLALEQEFLEFEKYKNLFSPWQDDVKMATESILELIELLAKTIGKNDSAHKTYELEFLYNFSKAFKQVDNFIETYQAVKDLKTLKIICNQIISGKTIAFYGEPLKGLQIMGMLETRNLDFENIIMLSTNEGILPAGKSMNSFIPYEVKIAFNLPTYTEKDAIFAYHFYRLIQRAKNITLIYNTETDEFGSGEKSRFVTQIINELTKTNPNASINEQIYALPSLKNQTPGINIIKNDSILEKLLSQAKRGFSPSAINTYLKCPLDFYYKYIIGLRETEEVEETIEASTLGVFIHEVLQNLYTEFIGKVITAHDIKAMKPKVENLTKESFHKQYDEKDLEFGKNRLIISIAIKYVHNLLDKEIHFINELKNQGKTLTIIALEQKLSYAKKIIINGVEQEIGFSGNADRIDRIANEYRIIDYKTGSVDEKDVRITDIQEVIEKGKSLQLLSYALLFEKEQKIIEKGLGLKSGIISLRKPTDGFINLSYQKKEDISALILEDFEVVLEGIIKDMFSLELPFEHKKDAEYCSFCQQKNKI